MVIEVQDVRVDLPGVVLTKGGQDHPLVVVPEVDLVDLQVADQALVDQDLGLAEAVEIVVVDQALVAVAVADPLLVVHAEVLVDLQVEEVVAVGVALALTVNFLLGNNFN